MSQKKSFIHIFFFSCLKAVIGERMLLELGYLLLSFLLRIFFSAAMRQGQYFLENILAVLSVYLEVQKEIRNHHDIWVGGWATQVKLIRFDIRLE